ncbi:MAG TPA: Os1348 family NHLP clan protein [Acidimicrobiia bacterium]|nr:Os1348 family NHLP clan protein [Acidimicrobiia bacterium]
MVLDPQRKGHVMEQFPPELLGRAMQDPDFRRRLLTDPHGVVTAEGYDLDGAQLDALSRLDPETVDDAIDALIGDLDGAKWG